MPDEADTRTYYSEQEDQTFCSRCGADCSCIGPYGPQPASPRASMTRSVVVGHENFPCPPTRGQDTCQQAWETWRRRNGITLMRM